MGIAEISQVQGPRLTGQQGRGDMTIAEAILYALLGLALQFALIYCAIRLALRHDRAFQARGVEASAATRKAEVRRHAEVRPMPQDVEGIMQEMRASRERAEARRIAAVTARRREPVVPTAG
jgi:hypothetical protein